MNKTLLDEREVSIVTGVPPKTLQYWRFTGASFAPKFIKLGKRVTQFHNCRNGGIESSTALNIVAHLLNRFMGFTAHVLLSLC